MANQLVAAFVGCSALRVAKWRSRFVEHSLEGLSDDPRPGLPATISTDHVEDIVLATPESNPESVTHWSRSKMALLDMSREMPLRQRHRPNPRPRSIRGRPLK